MGWPGYACCGGGGCMGWPGYACCGGGGGGGCMGWPGYACCGSGGWPGGIPGCTPYATPCMGCTYRMSWPGIPAGCGR